VTSPRSDTARPTESKRASGATEAISGAESRLSRELSELLIELSIGVHRYAIYPPDHPSLGPVVDNVIGRLGAVFAAGRRVFSIGVGDRRLIIDGVATDPGHPVLSDLARRLHRHQLAAVTLEAGTRAREVEALLLALSRDTERDAEPLGLMERSERPRWEHVSIHPLGYGALSLSETDDGTDRSSILWLELARAAMGVGGPVGDGMEDSEAVARSIREAGEGAYDEVIVGYMLQLADELKEGGGGEVRRVRGQMDRLLAELDEDTLARLVDMGGDHARRRQFVLDANHSLAVHSVVKILEAAARSEGQTISSSLTRMLTKLSAHAERGGALGKQADTALRENVIELIDRWELEDPNPADYTALLDTISTASPIFEADIEGGSDGTPGAERILQMALELDAWGVTVEKALRDVADSPSAPRLIEMIADAEGTEAAAAMRRELADPELLRRVMEQDQVDDPAVLGLVAGLGEPAIDALLEVLSEAGSRFVRRRAFNALAAAGPSVGEKATERLSDGRWFVQRNMLALLTRLEEVPDDFDPEPWTRHDDARVRREAFALMFRDGSMRSRTLAAALGEEDERLVRMALLELRDGVPEALVPTVVNRVVEAEGRGPSVRALGVRALAGVRSPLIRDTLLGVAVRGRSLFGRPKLHDPSPPVLEAVSGLARTWKGDRGVDRVLAVAARSGDERLRAAAEGQDVRQSPLERRRPPDDEGARP